MGWKKDEIQTKKKGNKKQEKDENKEKGKKRKGSMKMQREEIKEKGLKKKEGTIEQEVLEKIKKETNRNMRKLRE